MTNLSVFEYNSVLLKFDAEMISLTSLWEMAGKPENQSPYKWSRLPETKRLIDQILAEKGIPKRDIKTLYSAKAGKGGATWAHWKLALDYAGYLSIELKSLFLGWMRDRIQEDANPDLAVERGRDRAIATWRKQGKSEEWIQQRIEGKLQRYQFTDTLKDHGVTKPHQYAACTNAIYVPVLGSTAKEIKEQRAIKRLRDGMSRVELMAVGLAEALAAEEIESENHQGFKTCHQACDTAGNRVKRVFDREVK